MEQPDAPSEVTSNNLGNESEQGAPQTADENPPDEGTTFDPETGNLADTQAEAANTADEEDA